MIGEEHMSRRIWGGKRKMTTVPRGEKELAGAPSYSEGGKAPSRSKQNLARNDCPDRKHRIIRFN